MEIGLASDVSSVNGMELDDGNSLNSSVTTSNRGSNAVNVPAVATERERRSNSVTSITNTAYKHFAPRIDPVLYQAEVPEALNEQPPHQDEEGNPFQMHQLIQDF